MAMEMMSLMKVINLSMANSVLDPWGFFSVVKDVLESVGLTVVVNCPLASVKAHTHLDATQPGVYQQWAAKKELDVIVTVPPTDLLDLAMPLAAKHASSASFFYVLPSVLTMGPPARLKWLQELQFEGRLCVIPGIPNGNASDKGLWLCVFSSRKARALMVKAPPYEDTVFTLG
jgi:hypothetical protein